MCACRCQARKCSANSLKCSRAGVSVFPVSHQLVDSTKAATKGYLGGLSSCTSLLHYHPTSLHVIAFINRPQRRTATWCSTPTEQATAPPAAAPSTPPSATPQQPTTLDAVFTSAAGTRWRVRPYDNGDYSTIVKLQTDSFHIANPVPFLHQFTYNNFRAEVIDGLRQKLRCADPAIFQLLVVEPVPEPVVSELIGAEELLNTEATQIGVCSSDLSAVVESKGVSDCERTVVQMKSGEGDGVDAIRERASVHRTNPVGVVEVSLQSDRRVLRALPDRGVSEDYAYVSSMCVQSSVRRKGAAQALLAAAEAQARLWAQPHLALHVYRENSPAVQLYVRYGMQVLDSDPGWKALLGDRVRLLMHKKVALVERNGEKGRTKAAGRGPVIGECGEVESEGE